MVRSIVLPVLVALLLHLVPVPGETIWKSLNQATTIGGSPNIRLTDSRGYGRTEGYSSPVTGGDDLDLREPWPKLACHKQPMVTRVICNALERISRLTLVLGA
jgi:hypothetical protein